MNSLERFSRYHHIWRRDREETIRRFSQGTPLLSEFESQILYYRDLEQEINAEPEFITVGALALYTGTLLPKYRYTPPVYTGFLSPFTQVHKCSQHAQ